MAKSTGKEYEMLTKEIFGAILKQESVKTTRIEHNSVVQGITAKHQIDVLWEFVFGGVSYLTLVQAKDWNQSVDIGKLIQFKGVLNDIDGQPRGVFVTKTGYQIGAKDFAEKNGIKLFELRDPRDEDWEGRIRRITFNLRARMPSCSQLRIAHDVAWMQSELQRLGLEDFEYEISGMENEIQLTNLEGAVIGTVRDITVALIPADVNDLPPEDRTHIFHDPTFIASGNPVIPRIKLSHLTGRVEVRTETRVLETHGDALVKFVLKDVLENKVLFIDHENRPRM